MFLSNATVLLCSTMTTSLYPYSIEREDSYFQSRIPSGPLKDDLEDVAVKSGYGKNIWQRFCQTYKQNNVEDWAWQACLLGPDHPHYEEAGWEVEKTWRKQEPSFVSWVEQVGDQIFMTSQMIDDGIVEN